MAAGVILHDGEVLLQKRGPGGHLAGLWEFPGGKVKRGETEKAALAREIREEIGIEVEILHRLLTTTHDYPDRQVAISYFLCALRGGRPPLEEASIRWVRCNCFSNCTCWVTSFCTAMKLVTFPAEFRSGKVVIST